jgi:pyruvate dehydrogenase E1 component beta subunit
MTSLLAPIERVTGFDTMMPYLRTEAAYMPDVAAIIDAVRRAMEYK